MTTTRRPKIGLRDVAKYANVSLATASRTLSNPDLVSQAVREKVYEACKALNYIPNRTARRLSQHRSETIGLIVPDISNPLFAPTIDGLRSVLDENDLGLMINSAERDVRRELAQVRTLLEYGVDGIVTLMPLHDDDLMAMVTAANVPLVHLSPVCDLGYLPAVRFDNATAMREMVGQVIAQGHRRIAVLSGHRSATPIVTERLDTVLTCLDTAGLRPPPEWIAESAFGSTEARAAAARILTQPERPTAIICTGDQHAAATVMEAHALNIDVPGALSVTGCNDVSLARLCHPRLTTIHLPYRELGTAAAELLLATIQGQEVRATKTLPHSIVMRESLAPPPKESS